MRTKISIQIKYKLVIIIFKIYKKTYIMAKGCWWFHDGLLSKGELNPNSPKCEGVNMYSEESYYKYI